MLVPDPAAETGRATGNRLRPASAPGSCACAELAAANGRNGRNGLFLLTPPKNREPCLVLPPAQTPQKAPGPSLLLPQQTSPGSEARSPGVPTAGQRLLHPVRVHQIPTQWAAVPGDILPLQRAPQGETLLSGNCSVRDGPGRHRTEPPRHPPGHRLAAGPQISAPLCETGRARPQQLARGSSAARPGLARLLSPSAALTQTQSRPRAPF